MDWLNVVGNVAGSLSAALLVFILGWLVKISNRLAVLETKMDAVEKIEKRVTDIESELNDDIKPFISNLRLIHKNELLNQGA